MAASTNFFGVGKGQEEQFDQIDSTLPDINWVLEMMGQEDTSNYFDWNAFQNPSSHSLGHHGLDPTLIPPNHFCPDYPIGNFLELGIADDGKMSATALMSDNTRAEGHTASGPKPPGRGEEILGRGTSAAHSPIIPAARLSHFRVSDGSSPETASLSQLCPYCPRRIRDNQCYERHLRLHDANDTSAALLCEYCQGRFRTQGYLNRHRLTCRNPRTCPHCHRSFKHQTNFRRHCATNPCLKQNLCPTCQRIFSNAHQLATHVLQDCTKFAYQCSDCGGKFCDRDALRSHRKPKSGPPPPYTCANCHQLFTKKCLYNRHIKQC
ncbi:hypothetical protein BJ085DRAFT_41404 [Dimargaris cristalligena]|uniref:C2H2-type domain-containing protein n=1 Tax=Dimargaris cristalligena TaxID=215637 RepID=A0A4P9ZTM3_9FUNG|nr:hypothetical protein BJ085DRAFT_41404 [Dimargaris cristalligena]|eukprot:RKP36873.1 hypothetical protein BJ085DRAFT_41404 [Dimargaris cristalligena]